jgi:hypothetical protein
LKSGRAYRYDFNIGKYVLGSRKIHLSGSHLRIEIFSDILPKTKHHESTDILRITLKQETCDIISDTSNITTFLWP